MSEEDLARHGMVPMSEEHFPQVLALYGDSFGDSSRGEKREAWAKQFRRLYQEAPGRTPADETNWVLLRKGRVVGHVGFLYVRVKCGESERKAAWGIDLMADSGHRGGRGFVALLSTLDHAAELAMGYGMAEAVFRAYVARGYQAHEVSSHLVFPKRPWTAHRLFSSDAPWGLRHVERLGKAFGLFFRSRRPATPAGWRDDASASWKEVDLRGTPDAELDKLWHCLARDYAFAVVRDAAYLKWRYVAVPSIRARCWVRRQGGEITSLAILELLRRRGLRVLQISELLIPKAERARELPTFLGQLRRVFRQEEADILWTEGLPDHVRSFLRQYGFVDLDGERREKMVYLDAARSHPAGFEGEWMFSPGDSDRSTSYPRLPWRHGPAPERDPGDG